jgi:hypothetical protein
MRINSWLENEAFISKMKFNNLYYLETLCFKVAAFLKNIPVPVCATWDNKNKSIYFSIGENKHYIPIDTNIAYYDYITLIDKWARQFYPQYQVEIDTEIEYTDKEIMGLVSQGVSLNDAILMRKPHSYIEIGVIEKIFIKKDEFIFNRNGEREVRMSGKGVSSPFPLSKFMEGIRKVSDPNEKKVYIEEHSKSIVPLRDREKEIVINYSGSQMLNFIKINFEDNKLYPLIPIDEFQYHWGIFRVVFESKILRDDCLALYAKKLSKEK